MEGSAAMAKSNYQDFEDYVLPPLSPFTPYESTDRDIPQAGKAKANLSFTTVRVVHFFLVFCRARLCHLSFFPRTFSHSFLSPLPFFVVCDLLGSGSSTRRSPSLPSLVHWCDRRRRPRSARAKAARRTQPAANAASTSAASAGSSPRRKRYFFFLAFTLPLENIVAHASVCFVLQHDCTAYKKKCIQQGIEIQTRNRKGSGGSKKKPKSKVAKVMGHRPILTTVQANQAMMDTLEPVGVLPMS